MWAEGGDGQAGRWSGEWSGAMTSTLWRCEQVRAGQIYNKVMFNTRKEAETFVQQMTKVEPDMFWRLEAVPVAAVWN